MDIEQVIRDTFMLPDETRIEDSDNPDTLDGWVSLGHVSLLDALEEHFNITIYEDEIEAIRTVGDIKRIVRSKK